MTVKSSQPKEYEVSDLLAEIEALKSANNRLEAENALLRERETTLARDGIEVLNVVIETLRQLQPGKETTRFFVETKRKLKPPAPKIAPSSSTLGSKPPRP